MLQKLDCNSLKLCRLSFMVKEIIKLPGTQFDFLVGNVADFIRRQKLLQHLYCEDVSIIVHREYDPENDKLFKEFQKCSSPPKGSSLGKLTGLAHIELRPAKHKRNKCT